MAVKMMADSNANAAHESVRITRRPEKIFVSIVRSRSMSAKHDVRERSDECSRAYCLAAVRRRRLRPPLPKVVWTWHIVIYPILFYCWTVYNTSKKSLPVPMTMGRMIITTIKAGTGTIPSYDIVVDMMQ